MDNDANTAPEIEDVNFFTEDTAEAVSNDAAEAVRKEKEELENMFDSIPQDDVKESIVKSYEENGDNFKHQEVMSEQPTASNVNTTTVAEAMEGIGGNVNANIYDDESVNLLKNQSGSSQLSDDAIKVLMRQEEIAHAMVKEEGRFIEGSDQAKPGKTIYGTTANESSSINPFDFQDVNETVQDLTVNGQIRSDGIVFDTVVIDTGKGAQKPTEINVDDQNDPTSTEFIICVNKNCNYRDGCLRYRMSNKKGYEKKFVFFPDTCRDEGIYLSIDSTDYTAYSPMNVLESNSTPSI